MINKVIQLVIILLILGMIAGCASNPPISSLSSEERARISNIVFLESGEIPKDSYKLLGSVEGLACKRNLYASGAPSIEEARQGVKIRAAQLGANAIINLLCESNQKADWKRNCWQSVVCVGDAILINDPTILNRIRKQESAKVSKRISIGTGWVVELGFIVTNHHVINDATDIIGHFNDGSSLKLTLVADDPINDLALLLPPTNITLPRSISLAKKEAEIGETVFTVGFPHTEILGSAAKVTSGIISARSGLRDDLRLYQTTVQLQAGNSGSPLMNMNGEAVGVATSKLDAVRVFRFTGDLPEGINYAVKSQYVSALIASAETVKSSTKPDVILGPFTNLQRAVSAVTEAVVLIEAK
jgi:S1-C subfamily serine protease